MAHLSFQVVSFVFDFVSQNCFIFYFYRYNIVKNKINTTILLYYIIYFTSISRNLRHIHRHSPTTQVVGISAGSEKIHVHWNLRNLSKLWFSWLLTHLEVNLEVGIHHIPLGLVVPRKRDDFPEALITQNKTRIHHYNPGT